MASSVCLGCHGRANAEISLSNHPTLGPMFTDVHRDELGMGCTYCHTQNEMHGNGTEHKSMFEEGARKPRATTTAAIP